MLARLAALLDRFLVRNWRIVMRKSWSFWANILIALATGIAAGFTADGVFLWPMAAASAFAALLRITFQRGFDDEG